MTEFINALRAALGLGAIEGAAGALVVTGGSIASYGAGEGSAAVVPGGLHLAHVSAAAGESLWSAAIAAARCEGAERFRRSLVRL